MDLEELKAALERIEALREEVREIEGSLPGERN